MRRHADCNVRRTADCNAEGTKGAAIDETSFVTFPAVLTLLFKQAYLTNFRGDSSAPPAFRTANYSQNSQR